MCGITGMFNRHGAPASAVVLRRMTDAIKHRGPDGEGHYVDGPVGLGHRRLSIIDLSPAGHQPMMTRDGRYVISYNGEVYNYRELRIELEALGWQFHSTTDSEVVLYALAQWGESALLRFNGMFGLAFWDKQEKTLLLARDRYGIKPVYHSEKDGCFLFGSEIKAILEHPDAPHGVDREGLLEYFTFQNFFTEKTLFKGVQLLPAGSFLRVRADTPATLHRYWDFHFTEPQQPASFDEYVEELHRLFLQSVNRQLVSDVPVGSYLSGGMDSGSITAVAATQLPGLTTFTCGFDLSSASGLELTFDERAKAERMSYLFRTEHYEMVLKAGDMERCIPDLTWHLEEPRVGQCYPNYYAARLASKFVKVCLSGAGGDELFGGYPWRYYRAAVNDNFEDYIDKYYSYWQRLIPNTLIKKVFSPIWGDVKDVSTRDIFRDVFATHANQLSCPEDYINHSLYLEAKTFLHGLLVVEDKLSMAHSLETRVPFLDNDLVDFAMRLPTSAKLRNLSDVVRINENDNTAKKQQFFQRTNDGKLALRSMMSRLLPDDITNAEKQGFSSPDASWFKGESIEYVKRALVNPRARIYEFLDHETVDGLIHEHLDGKQNRRLLIWSLLNVESLLQRYFS